MYICICNAISERQVRECAKRGARSVEEVAVELGVGAGCGRCLECTAEVIKEVHHSWKESVSSPALPLIKLAEPSGA
jgi:bacterioferritin-associated ferredoxin